MRRLNARLTAQIRNRAAETDWADIMRNGITFGAGDCHCPSNAPRANARLGSDSHLDPLKEQR